MRENFKHKILSIDVITLDVHERVSAFIWSREVLPFDCVKILSVPKPIGGILVFSVNALFFLNQGIPPYAVSLNSLGDAAMEGIASKYLLFKFKATYRILIDSIESKSYFSCLLLFLCEFWKFSLATYREKQKQNQSGQSYSYIMRKV